MIDVLRNRKIEEVLKFTRESPDGSLYGMIALRLNHDPETERDYLFLKAKDVNSFEVRVVKAKVATQFMKEFA